MSMLGSSTEAEVAYRHERIAADFAPRPHRSHHRGFFPSRRGGGHTTAHPGQHQPVVH